VACNFNCCIEAEGLVKGTVCHVHCKQWHGRCQEFEVEGNMGARARAQGAREIAVSG